MVRKYSFTNKIPLIKSVKIVKLYDTFTYTLEAPMVESPGKCKLLLLYGNNGSGKTSILNLIFHLLASAPYEGHRSYVGRRAFRLFEIELGNGIRISASRKKSSGPGLYKLDVYDNKQTQLVEWEWHPDTDPDMKKQQKLQYSKYCDILNKLDLSFHYLPDSRRFEDAIPKRKRRYEMDLIKSKIYYNINDIDTDIDEDPFSTSVLLLKSIDKAIEWFRKQALARTNVGSTSVNSLYQDIIKRLVAHGDKESNNTSINTDVLIDNLIEIKERNKGFAKYGLTPEWEIDEILKALKSTKGKYIPILEKILGPYIDGHKARLDALQPLQKVIDDFITMLSDFYTHKKVKLHLDKGLEIISELGKELSPAILSSGEKQLLLLLCHAICARRDNSIFIIDEPEISLNIKWQRQLISSLITCLEGTNSQLILATHSIEILSKYKDHIVQLGNLIEG